MSRKCRQGTKKSGFFNRLRQSQQRRRRRQRDQGRRLFAEGLENRLMLTGVGDPGEFVDSGQVLGTGVSTKGSLGDLDGDGDLDLFQNNTSQGGGGSQVYLNDGSGIFSDTGQRLQTVLTFGAASALGDVDGDGDLDSVVIGSRADVWMNDGSGYFTAGRSLSRIGGSDVELSDLDGDGDLDAFASGGWRAARVWLNDGSGVFTDTGQSLGAGSYGTGVALGDFDGDGDTDAYVSNAYGGRANETWLNDGTGTFALGQSLGSGLSFDVELGDVDNDGDLDAFVANQLGSNELWINDGSGDFSDSGQSLGGALRSIDVGLADVDNDGDLDAVTTTIDGAGLTGEMFLNDGSGGFTLTTTALFDPHFRITSGSVSLGDLDADGDMDIVRSGAGAYQAKSVVFFNISPPVDVNVAPEITVDNATVTVSEGQTANNSGTVSDEDGDSVALSASAGSVTNNNDGTWSWSLDTDDGPADGTTITIEGDDGNGGTDDASFTLVVNNVAPDAAASGPASTLIGESVTITLGATDASSADQAAGFDYDIDWDGNGTVDQTVSGLNGTTVNHTFTSGGSTTVIVTATDKDGGESDPVNFEINVIQPVDLDVKPGNSQNKVNAKSQGVVPVAIYTTADFDAANVDGSSVQLAGVSANHFALEDIDNDGDLDLILLFAVQDLLDALSLDLDNGDEVSVEAELTGSTVGGVDLAGSDTVNFFRPGKGKGKK